MRMILCARWPLPGRVLALVLGLGVAAGAAPASATGLVLVVNSAGASLSVVDMATDQEVRRIPVLREPHHLALSPDGRDLLVGDTVGNEMLFLDPATFAIKRRMPLADPYQLGFSPDARLLTVTGLARNQVDIYDAATMQLLKRFPIASMPSHLAYAPDSSVVYVSLQGTGRLAAFDLRRMAVLWDEPCGRAPAGVMWQNGKVLVANMGEDNVAVVDPVDGHVERRIRTGKGAHQLFRSPDGKLIWVNNRVEGSTVALDATTLQVLRSYKVPGGPDDIEFAPDGKLWITERFAEKVAILDPASGAIRTVEVGRSPHGIFLNASAKTP
jgi:DNA-binding beta-propeller fold protein YncE